MNVLYLNGYKCLLSQNQRVIIDFLGYIRYDTLAKHIKPFFERHERKLLYINAEIQVP